MTDELTQADFQAIADLENVLCILKFVKKEKKGSLTAETMIFIESLLDEYKPIFLKQKDDLKSFAQNAKEFLSKLLAYQSFSSFVGFAMTDNNYSAPSRALDAEETKKVFEATRELANKIVNHFKLLEEEQKEEQDSKKVDNKNDER